MSYSTKLAFQQILSQSPALRSMQDKLSQLSKANQLVQSTLKSVLAQGCTVVNIRQGLLVLKTPSPAWRHKLRFYSLELLDLLRQDPQWCHLKGIETVTQPDDLCQPAAGPSLPGPIALSPASRNTLQITAKTVDSSELQAALMRLSEVPGAQAALAAALK